MTARRSLIWLGILFAALCVWETFYTPPPVPACPEPTPPGFTCRR